MITRSDLKKLVVEDGSGRVVDVCKYIWENHEDELRASGDMFFAWQ